VSTTGEEPKSNWNARLLASDQESAMAHLNLARMHQARRRFIVAQRQSVTPKTSVFGADKEA
jgi:hypothetical protein